MAAAERGDRVVNPLRQTASAEQGDYTLDALATLDIPSPRSAWEGLPAHPDAVRQAELLRTELPESEGGAPPSDAAGPDATAVIGDLAAEEGGQRLEDAAVGDDAVTEGLEGVTAQQILTAQRLLMVCGTGTRMTWYAVNVAIAYFSDLYGNEMYPMLLLAYNVSATLLVLGQATLDRRLIARFGVRRLFLVRVNAALACILAIAAALPFIPEYLPGELGESLVLLLVFLLGAMDYLASGTLTQISARYGGSAAAVFVGNTLCGVFLLAYTVATGFGAHHDGAGVGHSHETLEHCIWYFGYTSAFTLSAMVAFNVLWAGPVCKHIWPAGEEEDSTALEIEIAALDHQMQHDVGSAVDDVKSAAADDDAAAAGEDAPAPLEDEPLTEPREFVLMVVEGELVATKQKVTTTASTLAEVEAALASQLELTRQVNMVSICDIDTQQAVTSVRSLPDKGRVGVQEKPAMAAAFQSESIAMFAEPSFEELAAVSFNQESLLWRVFKNTFKLQMAQVLLWICCFGVQALFVVDAKLQQILVFENMFGFLLGQQLPDKLPTILPPTQGNLLAPAVFMCSFVVLADLYVLGVVPAAGPFLVCAFVFVFEVSLGAFFMSLYKHASSDRLAMADRSAATRCLNLSLQVGILLGLLHSYVLQLFDEGSANVSGENCVDLDANQSGVQNVLIGC